MKLAAASALSIALFSLTACGTVTSARQALLPGASASVSKPSSANVLGAMGNGLLGSAAGRLDKADRKKALEAEYKALEYARGGDATRWKGDDSASGEVVAAQPYQVGSQNCRQYTHTFTIDGAPQTARGTACRNADGSWTPLT